MENKKVRNAKETIIDGIKYKSQLEGKCAVLLKEAGLKFKYEEYKLYLVPTFIPALHYYQSTPKGMALQIKKDGDPVAMKSMSYTPDFSYIDNKVIIIMETKGFQNDVYPYKRKLFFHYMTRNKLTGIGEESDREIYFFEPRNIKNIKESINIIKNILCNN